MVFFVVKMKKEFGFGDYVEVQTKDEVLRGRVLPRPDLLNNDILILKLDNGYNIGIDKKNIIKINLMEKYSPVISKTKKPRPNPKLPNITILSFGGTISSKIDYFTGGVSADYTAEDFLRMIPELKEVANISARKVKGVMSEDMAADEWKEMAEAVSEELNKGADGVVVTQGTDTLHFSSAALSFMLEDLNKPVVFTASQRSIDRGSSDAFMNLYCAVVTAARFNGAMVLTCLHGSSNDDYCLLIRGPKVRKMHTSRRDAFRPINSSAVAKVYYDGRIETLIDYYPRVNKETQVIAKTDYEEKIALVYVYPGMDPGIIDYYANKEYKGIIIAGTALGHVPTQAKKSLIPALKRAINKGIFIGIASQTLYGKVHPYVYSNLRKLSIELGACYLGDMLPETAYVKLGCVMGRTTDINEVKELMLKNIAGEISERSSYREYLS